MKDFENWVNEKHPEYEQESEPAAQEETKEDMPTEGYGKTVKGKSKPITPWKGSWAQKEEEKRNADKKKDK